MIIKMVTAKKIVTNKWLYIMLIPGITGFVIFSYIPMYGLIIAFQRYNIIRGFLGSPWIGSTHFTNFFKDPYFFRLIKNTLLLSFYSLLWGFPIPITFALLLNEIRTHKFKRFVQAVSYLPHFLSTVIVVGMLFSLTNYDGIINNIIAGFGFERINFRTDPAYFRTLYIASGIWQQMGWESIVYLAAITGVNPELYEAARIDGSNRFQMMRYITIPGISPTIVVLLILKIGKLLNVGFEKVYLMYNPLVYEKADIIATYVFRRGIEGGQFSYAAAVGLFNSLLAVILLIGANKIARRLSDNYLW
jgi:putative aldouronate transport system permease protein